MAIPPTIAARWTTWEQPAMAALRVLGRAQVAGVDLAAFAHPLGRGALVGDADLIGGVGQQVPHDGGADRAGPAGDEDPAHPPTPSATSSEA